MGHKLSRHTSFKRTHEYYTDPPPSDSIHSRVVIPDIITQYQILDAGMPKQYTRNNTNLITNAITTDITITDTTNNNNSVPYIESVEKVTKKVKKEDDDLTKRLDVITDFLTSQQRDDNFSSFPSVLDQFNKEPLHDVK